MPCQTNQHSLKKQQDPDTKSRQRKENKKIQTLDIVTLTISSI